MKRQKDELQYRAVHGFERRRATNIYEFCKATKITKAFEKRN